MFANAITSRSRRRAVVLVVVLGMLGLLAVVGFTFATFSGQSQINSRNFSQAQMFPDAEEMMDFALSQLIDDTNNPQSVIRGHSLKRDMYGNDALFNGALLNGFPDGSGAMAISSVGTSDGSRAPLGLLKLVTNIPTGSGAFYSYENGRSPQNYFARWILRFPTAAQNLTMGMTVATSTFLVGETHEILYDDTQDPTSGGYRVFYISPPYFNAKNPTMIDIPATPGSSSTGTPASNPIRSTLPSQTQLPIESSGFMYGVPTSTPFSLDGRYLHAFNGPGLASLGYDLGARPLTEYANFRYNGNMLLNALAKPASGVSPAYAPTLGDPNYGGDLNHFAMPSMDEDYDACDLENWFLAIQTADGKVAIPSFHRPGILRAADWTTIYNSGANAAGQTLGTRAMSRILRPRQIDGHSPISFPDLLPDATTHKVAFDVDNDGDGSTDSVWLDLGYPAKRDASGHLFKPMFAFMVVGLNGKLPLNTAGNLQGRTVGLVPTNDHTEHLGNSPSEIDLRFALQNAFDPNNPAAYSQYDNAGDVAANSPSNVPNPADPSYATPNNASNQLGGISVAMTQLRNLLAGTRPWDPSSSSTLQDVNQVMVNGQLTNLPNGVGDAVDANVNGFSNVVIQQSAPIAGRWGEEYAIPGLQPVTATPGGVPSGMPMVAQYTPPDGSPAVNFYIYSNKIRAGKSIIQPQNYAALDPNFDSRDDDFTSFDAFPTIFGSSLGGGEGADFYDASGSILLPVERIRRFVTPADLAGTGRIETTRGKLQGSDKFGRVNFFHYFRPPGMALPLAGSALYSAARDWTPAPYTYTNGGATQPNPTPEWYDPTNHLDVRTNNLYHGYMSHLTPQNPPGYANALDVAGMPTDFVGGNPVPVLVPNNTNTPTFETATMSVNSKPAASNPFNSTIASFFSQAGSLMLDDANEMDLYGPTRFDAPFGPNDLEWLYRAQDTDGSSLQSRLKYLAPISFLNPLDGSRRRRLFALDSWDLNNFVWANDNPQGGFSRNSHFAYLGNADLQGLVSPGITPSVAHRNRRINLNFPLPVSNSPVEPIRQKWIRETYTFLKSILPPKAIDTPEELAQLSQFVVNIVDFRDPDCTMTKFVNTDITVSQPDATHQSKLTFSTSTLGVVPYDASLTPSTNSTYSYLIQYGMEYQPVAINEVLALKFQTMLVNTTSTSGTDQNYESRVWIELVNTLTKDAIGNTPDSSDLDLAGWDFVVLPDNTGFGRPDPFTGQIPAQPFAMGSIAPDIHAYPVSGINPAPPSGTPSVFKTPADGSTPTPATGVTSMPGVQDPGRVQALSASNDTNAYYVFSNQPPTTVSSSKEVQGNAMSFDPASGTTGSSAYSHGSYLDDGIGTDFDPTNASSGKDNKYYWLYLRRPPNPFDTSYDPTKPFDNRVVVDAFRFVYTTSPTKGYTDTTTSKQKVNQSPTGTYFSLQRMQPYRGGHAVPPLSGDYTGAPTKFVLPAYGYSEQTAVPKSAVASGATGNYGNFGTGASTTANQTTTEILHTLGKANSTYGSLADDNWDYFAFNDRDFTSVVELAMVPGCPPGLFTKQFAEVPPPINDTSTGVAGSTPELEPLSPTSWAGGPWPNAGSAPTRFLRGNRAPHSNPYLPDEFFYTATNDWAWPSNPGVTITPVPYLSVNGAGNNIGGPSAAGWHKMLDFFEVPSPVISAIGPVTLGTNYDWYRQDLRPGLLNLNLIVDEEVFLGLMGNSVYQYLNQQQVGLNDGTTPLLSLATYQVPRVVTQIDDNGAPTAAYPMQNVGAFGYTFNDTVLARASAIAGNLMKACFSDFLKLRHGGSGFVFAWGNGGTGQFGQNISGTTQPVAADRPFRSLSFPDIDYTIMRPATLPPTLLTSPAATVAVMASDSSATTPDYINGFFPTYNTSTTTSTPVNFTQDPGLKSPYLFTRIDPVQPPPVPPRRLFQIPDFWGSDPTFTISATNVPSNADTGAVVISSTDSLSTIVNNGFTGDPNVNQLTVDNNLLAANPLRIANPAYDLTSFNGLPSAVLASPPAKMQLGGDNGGGASDQRDQPFFRTEWLQKIANLTTVRTHQYAVWITVGFFEVTRQGDPSLAATRPDLAYDLMGLELGALEGHVTRYRGFFLLDRTRAVGFNPALPGDFRDVVVYRQLIE